MKVRRVGCSEGSQVRSLNVADVVKRSMHSTERVEFAQTLNITAERRREPFLSGVKDIIINGRQSRSNQGDHRVGASAARCGVSISNHDPGGNSVTYNSFDTR